MGNNVIYSSNFQNLSQLEVEIVTTALREIAIRDMDILISHDPKVYEQASHAKGHRKNVHVLCDWEGDLQDITPFLEFVTQETRDLYERQRDLYLRGN